MNLFSERYSVHYIYNIKLIIKFGSLHTSNGWNDHPVDHMYKMINLLFICPVAVTQTHPLRVWVCGFDIRWLDTKGVS